MFETHTTREGQTLFISQMEDSHLINTIRAYVRKLNECKAILEAAQAVSTNVLAQAFGVASSHTLEHVRKQMLKLHQTLQPYVLVATVRSLNITKELQSFYGTGHTPSALAGISPSQYNMTDDDEDDEEYDHEHNRESYDYYRK